MIKHPLDITQLTCTKRKAPTGEPRLQGRPQKIAHIDDTLVAPIEPGDIDVPIIKRKLLSNNAENKPVSEIENAMSVTKISSKVYKSLMYE